ncbi:hypothetical protein SAMN04487897_1713 [Paenibacillus sp. yr247]|uniref:hypothetical protein n=1 Tax=Paenibacillus sp. yr247 TaxID=1761880 RepID=UPI00087E7B72|nr:hypothetical protein [Paenibacillus sp. yr247]SDP30081.1 hypothetical protein SAMN04487897_1713 [Paenibacillus sp. yr247]
MKKYNQECPRTKKYMKKVYRVKRLFMKYGLIPYEISKKGIPNYQNLRVEKNNQIIIIDYGIFRFRRKR